MPGVRLHVQIYSLPLLTIYLLASEPGAVRVFPYQLILTNNNTAENCLSQCSNFGYAAAGMELADECCMLYTPCRRASNLDLQMRMLHPGCGDVADITNNGGATAPEKDCTMACSGDPLHLCGGPQRLQLYLWSGSLATWNTPANTGHYEVRTYSAQGCTCSAERPST